MVKLLEEGRLEREGERLEKGRGGGKGMGSRLGGGALLILEELESLLEEVESFCGELEPVEEKLAISLIKGDSFTLKKKKLCRYKRNEE